jgi:DNA invertase Pin-like site-specific DNA recombinase
MTLIEAIEATLTPTRVGVTYAVGVIRVSETAGRDQATRRKYTPNEAPRRAPRAKHAATTTDRFKSPTEQRERIDHACRSEQLELAQCFTEIDVKGKWPLKRRKGLLKAIEIIEAGYAKVLVVAYFDRLVRSLEVQREVLERVEAAGGKVLAVDFGEVATRTASQWLSSTLVGAVAEYYSRSVKERLGGTQAMSIKDGIPIGTIPVGYTQDPLTRRLKVVPEEAVVMQEAFRMRADGASWTAVRNHLARHGIIRSTGSVRKLLHSKTYLGWVFHGDKVNPKAHEPIIDEATFDRVARRKGKSFGTPGRKSKQLLAGLRLLKCASCGRSMATGAQVHGGKSYPLYRCNPNLSHEGFGKRTQIDAAIADAFVADYVRGLIADESTTEGFGMELIRARAATAEAKEKLDTATINLATVRSALAAQTLADLQADYDAKADYERDTERRAQALGARVLNAGADWDRWDLDERREFISAVLERVDVTPAGIDDNGRRLPRGASRLHPVERLS